MLNRLDSELCPHLQLSIFISEDTQSAWDKRQLVLMTSPLTSTVVTRARINLGVLFYHLIKCCVLIFPKQLPSLGSELCASLLLCGNLIQKAPSCCYAVYTELSTAVLRPMWKHLYAKHFLHSCHHLARALSPGSSHCCDTSTQVLRAGCSAYTSQLFHTKFLMIQSTPR